MVFNHQHWEKFNRDNNAGIWSLIAYDCFDSKIWVGYPWYLSHNLSSIWKVIYPNLSDIQNMITMNHGIQDDNCT